MRTERLLNAYVQANLIQFGRFERAEGFAPLALNFLLLPSFPALMRDTARALLPLLRATPADRLLATRATTPLGAVLAVESGIPLTYEYGEMRGVSNAFIIEGAYDVGHPTTLLTYTLDSAEIMTPARKVGLNVTDILCLLKVGEHPTKALEAEGLRVHALIDLAEALDQLPIPAPLLAHVQEWIGR